jgi:subtilisin family serine protease
MLKTLESNKMKLKLSLVTLAVLGTLSAHAQTSPQMYLTPEGKTVTLEQYQTSTILSRIGAPQAWARGYTGQGIKIAVLDQGFDLGHADLKSNVIGYQNFYAGSIASKNAGWGYHGTAMASTAAGALNGGVGTVGVAYNASLLLGQVGQGGNMPNIDTAAVIRGLNQMVGRVS